MKKQYLALLSSLFILTACKSPSTKNTESMISSTTVSSTTTSTTKESITKEQPTTTKEASETKQETTTQEAKKVIVKNNTTSTPTSMNIEEIKTGNLSSIKGTWRNGYGQELTFHENGTVSIEKSTFKVQLTKQQYQEGLLNWIFTPLDNQPTIGSAIMTFVPKNQVVTYGLLEGNKDTSDTTKDRLFGTQQVLSSDALKKAMYYKVSE